MNVPVFMGILNVTPDSFSDGGKFLDARDARNHFLKLIDDGADIIDIGAESTGPGTKATSADEEILKLKSIFDIPEASETCISVDTYRAETARFCLERGASIINDVSGLRADENMAGVIAEYEASVVIMYSKQDGSHPNAEVEALQYKDVIKTISDFFKEQISYAESQGIKTEKIILDPGMGGFISSDGSYSWEILRRLSELRTEFDQFRLLIGTSRKSFLGGDLDKRDPVSQLTGLAAFKRGADIIRTHEVAMARELYRAWSLLEL